MNKVYVNLCMLCLSMMNQVIGEVHNRHVVAVDDSSLVNVDVELLKKVLQPMTLDRGIGDAMVFCFGARMVNHYLPHEGPGTSVSPRNTQ
jgi:hypothetical protein